MNSSDITKAVVKWCFPPRRYAVCPNVSWALLPWEADILAVSGSGVVNEIEIKTSVSDLKRDLAKSKWRVPGWPWSHIDRFWLAGPSWMESQMRERALAVGGGVIVVSDSGFVSVAVAAARHRDRRVDITASAIHRLTSLRFWDKEFE